MARCEDFPCCGHESGCCPDYDETGRQINMRCVCGAMLPINNQYSLCNSCLSMGDEDEYSDFEGEERESCDECGRKLTKTNCHIETNVCDDCLDVDCVEEY